MARMLAVVALDIPDRGDDGGDAPDSEEILDRMTWQAKEEGADRATWAIVAPDGRVGGLTLAEAAHEAMAELDQQEEDDARMPACYGCGAAGVELTNVEAELNTDHPDGELTTVQLCKSCVDGGWYPGKEANDGD